MNEQFVFQRVNGPRKGDLAICTYSSAARQQPL